MKGGSAQQLVDVKLTWGRHGLMATGHYCHGCQFEQFLFGFIFEANHY
jgi:hypothetical protein